MAETFDGFVDCGDCTSSHDCDEEHCCDACGYHAPQGGLISVDRKVPGHDADSVCMLCYGSGAGMYMKYTHAYSASDVLMMRTVCYVGNAVIDVVKGVSKS